MTNPIHYVPGTGKNNKAAYLVGTEKVPAAVITRLLTALQDQSGAKLDRQFYQGLGKYPAVLDAMEAYGLTPSSAVAAFTKIRNENEKPRAPKQQRVSKVEKAAEVFAKGICKRFKGTPKEMVDAFLDIVGKPEFRDQAIDVIAAYLKNHGKSTLGYVKTSNRKGNPAAQKALATRRAQVKGK